MLTILNSASIKQCNLMLKGSPSYTCKMAVQHFYNGSYNIWGDVDFFKSKAS